jgi:hypothetical protein
MEDHNAGLAPWNASHSLKVEHSQGTVLDIVDTGPNGEMRPGSWSRVCSADTTALPHVPNPPTTDRQQATLAGSVGLGPVTMTVGSAAPSKCPAQKARERRRGKREEKPNPDDGSDRESGGDEICR